MARIIPKRVLEDIRFANEIAEVIGSYLTLHRAGTNFKGLCPFHKEKTPSFTVNTQRQSFHCFGCGEGGDVFSFVMKHEGVDFVTAASILAQRANITLDLEDDIDDGGPKKDVLFKINAEVAEFYQRCLMQTKGAAAARKYLQSRDLGEDAIEKFRIGYAPRMWDSMLKWGEKHKHSTEELEAAGLILQSTRPDARSKYYDRFRDRLMFPITDIQGRVVGFSGRALEKDAKTAKYVNSPETKLFHKSRILYAMDKARKVIVNAKPREAIICEGQIDVVRCHLSGFENAVAAQGTAFTEDHAKILSRYADSVVIVFDTDKAGQDAAVKAARIFISSGLAVRVAALPEGSDPDSFISEKGGDAFSKVVENAVSAVAFQIDVIAGRENISSEVGTMRTSKAVLETIDCSESSVQKAKLLQEAAERLNVLPSDLKEDMAKIKARNRGRLQKPSAAPAQQPAQRRERPREEVQLAEHLVHVLDFPEMGELVKKYLPSELMFDRCCRQVLEAAVKTLESGRSIDEEVREFVDTTGELQTFWAGIVESPLKVKSQELSRIDAVKDIIMRIWCREKEKERARLSSSGSKEDKITASELTLQLHSMKNWDDAADIIEMSWMMEDG